MRSFTLIALAFLCGALNIYSEISHLKGGNTGSDIEPNDIVEMPLREKSNSRGSFMEGFNVGVNSISCPPSEANLSSSPNDVICDSDMEIYDFDNFEHQNVDPAVNTQYCYTNGKPSTHGAYNGSYGIYLNIQNGVAPSILYDREYQVCSGGIYSFSMWMSTRYGGVQCDMTISVLDENDNVLTSSITGPIPYATSGWTFWTSDLFVADGDIIKFQVMNNVPGSAGGNDFAFDDLTLEMCDSYGDSAIVTDALGNIASDICENDLPYDLELTVTPDNSVFTDHFYQWQESVDASAWTDIPGVTGQTVTVEVSTSGYYRAMIAENQNNLIDGSCVSYSNPYYVSIVPNPNPPVSGGDQSVDCNQGGIDLSVTVPSGISVNWYDAPSDGNLLLADSSTYYTDVDGVFYAAAVSNLGCESERIPVTVITDYPEAPISGGDILVCETADGVVLSADVPEGVIVNWYDSEVSGNLLLANSSTFYPTESGVYYAEAEIEASGCTSATLTAVELIVYLLDVEFEIVSEGNSTIVVNIYENPENYEFSLDGEVYQASNVFENMTAGVYTIYVREIGSDCYVVKEFMHVTDIPNVITPNNDGFNDYFDLTGWDVHKLEIYSRYGVLVYSKSNYLDEWHGQSDGGDNLPVGTYFYVMQYGDNQSRVDWIYVTK